MNFFRSRWYTLALVVGGTLLADLLFGVKDIGWYTIGVVVGAVMSLWHNRMLERDAEKDKKGDDDGHESPPET